MPHRHSKNGTQTLKSHDNTIDTAALVHKNRERDFGKNDTISIRSSSSNANVMIV